MNMKTLCAVISLMTLASLGGCSSQSQWSGPAPAISSNLVMQTSLMLDMASAGYGADSEAWEAYRLDPEPRRRGGIPDSAAYGIVDRVTRERLRTHNGRPREYYSQNTRIRTHRSWP